MAIKTVYKKRKCLVCDTEFTPNRSWQVYCRPKCQWTNYNLINDVKAKVAAHNRKVRGPPKRKKTQT